MVSPSSSSSCWSLRLHAMEREKRGGSSCFRPPSRLQATKANAVAASSSPFGSRRRRPYASLCMNQCLPQTEAITPIKKMEGKEQGRRKTQFMTPEKLDQCLSESIGEIVRNIGEAPFLVNIFSDGDDGAPRTMSLETKCASPEGWTMIKKKWDQENGKPDAVILVEELNQVEDDLLSTAGTFSSGDIRRGASSTKTWGLVVQGRESGCASCYILNTSRVRSTFGFCTHFYLVRARLGEPLDVQLKNNWLV